MPPFCFCPLGGRGSPALPTAVTLPDVEFPELLPMTPTLLVCASPPPTGLGVTTDEDCAAVCVVPRPKTALLIPVVPGADPKRPVEAPFPFVPGAEIALEFATLALTIALAVPDAAAWAYGAGVEPCRGPGMLVLDAGIPERPRPGIWPTPLGVGTPLLARPRLRAWLKLEAGLGVSKGWTWLLGALMLEGEVVDVGLGKRLLGAAADTEVLNWELMAFLDWCCCWPCCICCWMAEL